MDDDHISAGDDSVDGAENPDVVAPPEQLEDDDRSEKAGLYLASIIAVILPSLIVAAFFLSQSPSSDRVESTSVGTGLERIDVDNTALDAQRNGTADDSGEAGESQVAGASVTRTGETGETGETVEVAPAESDSADSDTSGDSGASPTDDAASALDGDATVVVAGPASSDDDPAVATSEAAPADDAATSTAPSTTAPPTTTERPTTTVAPTTTTRATTTTTDGPATTTTRPTTTTEQPASTTTQATSEPPEFSQRIDIGRIGETSLAMRFETTSDSRYTVIVRSGGDLVKSENGTAVGDQLVNEVVNGLTPGTDYTVHVVLNGTSQVVSPPVSFRTSGGTPAPTEVDVALLNARVVDLQSRRFEVNYESNICANGSFVIREQGGAVVGRNSGQAAGCTTRHLAIPGYWTPALEPNTTYVITITVEANGAGQGNGNTASTSLTVTTAS